MKRGRPQGIGRTSTIYVAGTLMAKGARFFLIPIYVRQLSADDVGVLIFLEAVTTALSSMLALGLDQAVKRFYAEYETEDAADNFAATLWYLGFVIALGFGGLLIAATFTFGQYFSRQIPAELFVLAIASGTLRSNLVLAQGRFIVREEAIHYSLFNLGYLASTTAFTVALVIGLNMGVRGALWADITALLIWNGIAAASVSRLRWPRFDWRAVRSAMSYSLPVVPHHLFTWAIVFSDRLILERFVTLAALGLYGIGYQMASALTIFSRAFTNAWLPRFFRTAAGPSGPAQFSRLFTAQFLAILSISLVLMAFAPEAIRLITTPEYDSAAPIMRVVLVGMIFHGIYRALLMPLFYRKRTGAVSAATGMALMSMLVLNLLLIPNMGIIGAAFATLAAYVLTTAFVGLLVAKHYPVPIDWRRVCALALGALVVGITTVRFDVHELLPALAAKSLLLLSFYASVTLIPGVLGPKEPSLFRRLWRHRGAPVPATQAASPGGFGDVIQ